MGLGILDGFDKGSVLGDIVVANGGGWVNPIFTGLCRLIFGNTSGLTSQEQ